MLLKTVTALESNSELLQELQETHQYVLADEHQDVNGAQNRLLELLLSYHKNPNIFAVGDEKQAIFRFQGASLENFLYFESKFPGVKTMALTDNYRSGPQILAVAHSLIAVPSGPLAKLRVPLKAVSVPTARVTKHEFSHEAREDHWLVETIKTHLKDGLRPSEIAVIVRTNQAVEKLTTLMRQSEIAVTASADGDILKHSLTNTILELLQVVVEASNEAMLFRVLHQSYWGISPADLTRVVSQRSYNQPLSGLMANETKLKELELDDPATVQKVHQTLKAVRLKMVSEAPHRVLEYLLQTSGLLDQVITHDSQNGARVVRRLYDEVETLVKRGEANSLISVIEALRLRQQYNLPLTAPYITTDLESVRVMTTHKSKGLEFQVVFMPYLTDKLWGGGKHRELFNIPLSQPSADNQLDDFDDEKRLLYVGMTRAKETLYLSNSTSDSEGNELITSRLVVDLALEKTDPPDQTVADFNPIASLTLPQSDNPDETLPTVNIDPSFLRYCLHHRGFSATSFNNYLQSPWNYFYRNVLRIPEIQSEHLLYGTVIHTVLQRITAHYTSKGVIPSDTEMAGWLATALGRQPLTTIEYTRLHEKALTALAIYLTHLKDTLPTATKEELSISVVFETDYPAVPTIPLTGKLDRIDLDESGQALRVVDYKTGRPKTRNAILGKTKNDDGNYHRQLVFYALLLNMYDDERYRTQVGNLSFVEADTKGHIREEEFTITDDEINDLKQQIKTAVKDISQGAFLAKPL